MLKRFIIIVIGAFVLVSCQFSETMVINEDGTGTMTLGMDVSEMMAFGNEFSKDSTLVKTDTIISFKSILEEKKDSIAKLPKKEQQRLKKMENYNIRMQMDPESNATMLSVFTNFKNVNEANDLMKGFEQTQGLMPGDEIKPKEEEGGPQPEILGVNYQYNNGKFTRDAYIKDKEKHAVQIDSLAQAEAFMGGMKYTLKYTFPRKIVKSSIEDARFSLDGKTIEVERSFLEYFKDPNVLDLEVELEN